MEITVAICTHNRCRLLEKTLDSLVAMAIPAGLTWEVLVVDNNSTDPTAAVVERYASQYPSFPIRRYMERQAGVAFARNAGVAQAAGEIIAFVDDDVIVDPSWLTTVRESFLRDPELAILGGRLKANPQSEPPTWLDQINTAPLGLIDYGEKTIRIDFPYLATANCAFRKTAIVSAGMFDTRLGRRPDKLYADEDTEMVARILSRGGKVVYEPMMMAFHFIPDSRMTKDYFRRWYRERGEGVGLVGVESGRRLFGIAFYEYRALLSNAAVFARNVVSRRATFQQELFIGYFVGILAGRMKRMSRSATPGQR